MTPDEEGKPSKAALFVEMVGDVMGRSMAHSIMASLGSEKGKVARLANSFVEEGQTAQNPLLRLLSGGRRGKGAGLASLVELLVPMLANKLQSPSSGNGDWVSKIGK